jgi:hypothetical protein
MAEWRDGRMAEWRDGGMAEGGMAEWYFPTYLIYPLYLWYTPTTPTMPMMPTTPTTPTAFKSFRCTEVIKKYFLEANRGFATDKVSYLSLSYYGYVGFWGGWGGGIEERGNALWATESQRCKSSASYYV